MIPTLNALIPAALALAWAVVSGSAMAHTGSTNGGTVPDHSYIHGATLTKADIQAINIRDQINLTSS